MKRVLVYGMTDNPGGIESYLMFLMDKLKAYDICLDFVTDFPTIAYDDRIKASGGKVFFIPPKGKKLFKHWMGMRKILKAHPEYESIYFNLLDAGGVFTAIVAKLMRRKVIVHSHNGDTDKVKLHKRCKKALSSIADGFVSCSKLAGKYMFTEKKQDKVLIIPNAIDVDRYSFDPIKREEVRASLDVSDNFVVCHIGRITRQKNPYRVLDIFEAVYKKEPSAVLLYIGEGDMSEEIKTVVSSKGLPIKMLGTRGDIPDIMQAADVLLLPSLYEGFPIVSIEAQTAGLPTVMSTNITDEIGLTDRAVFIDLDKSDDEWADKIIYFKNETRTGQETLIREKGYDKNCMSGVFENLAGMF